MSTSGYRSAVAQEPALPVRGAAVVVSSVLVNAVLALAAQPVGIAPNLRALTLPPVVFLSAVTAAGAVIVYWLLWRYVRDADRWFVRIATAVLVLSVFPDLAILQFDEAATVAGVVVLVSMHVVVAALAVGLLVYWRQ